MSKRVTDFTALSAGDVSGTELLYVIDPGLSPADRKMTLTVLQTWLATQNWSFSGSIALTGALTLTGLTVTTNGITVTGASSITGALTGVTTLTTSGAINGQTISSAASFTGTLAVSGTTTLTGLTVYGTLTAYTSYTRADTGLAGRVGAAATIIGGGSNTDYLGLDGESGIQFGIAGSPIASFNSSGAASFSGTLAVGGAVTISGSSDLNLPGGGYGITNSTSRFLAIASGANPALTFGSGAITMGGTLGVGGAVTSTVGNNAPVLVGQGATTGYIFANFTNTSGQLRWAVEGSSGGSLVSGSSAYASLLGSTGATSLQLFTSNTTRLTIDSAGAATFSGTLSVGGAFSGDVLGCNIIQALRLSYSSTDGGYIGGYTTGGTRQGVLSLGVSTDFLSSGQTGLYSVTANPLILGTNALARITISSSGAVRFHTYGGGTATFDASGNISSVSDERHKTDIVPFTAGLTALRGIAPITHKYNADSGLETEHTYIGFSAQNVLEHIPGAVFAREDGILSLWDRGILAATVNAVKALDDRITALEAAH